MFTKHLENVFLVYRDSTQRDGHEASVGVGLKFKNPLNVDPIFQRR